MRRIDWLSLIGYAVGGAGLFLASYLCTALVLAL
jgi:hypothetical protein